MNKTLITLLVSGLLGGQRPGAAGQDNTWYGGAKLGWSNFYGVDEQRHRHRPGQRRRFGAGASPVTVINQNLGSNSAMTHLGKLKYSGTRNGNAFNDSVEAQLAQLTLKLGSRLRPIWTFTVASVAAMAGPDSDNWKTTAASPSSARSVRSMP